MRAPLRSSLFILLLAGCDAGEPSSDVRPRAQGREQEFLVCPVEGTRFRSGSGVAARTGTGTVTVCSEGCRLRLELEVEQDR